MENTWQRFLQDLELSKHYPHVYMLSGSSGVRNPLLENLLPSFLFVRLVSLLDEGLKSYIIAENLGKTKRGDLHHRIEFLAEKGRLRDKQGCTDSERVVGASPVNHNQRMQIGEYLMRQ